MEHTNKLLAPFAARPGAPGRIAAALRSALARMGPALLMLLLPAFPTRAQDAWEQFSARLTKEEREQVLEVTARSQAEIRVAQAELDVIRARVNRLLLESDVKLGEVEKLLREALEWELKVRLAEISRELEIRKIVGDRRWAQYVELRRAQEARLQSSVAQRVEQQIDRIAKQILEWKASRQNQEEIEERIKALLRQMLDRADQTAAPAPR